MSVFVSKADGTTEPFDSSKLHLSLTRAGVDETLAAQIEKEVTKELYNGVSTSQIYRRAFAHLREHRHGAAARYSLKRAVLEFGPSGFPFEAYIAELFRKEGYTAQIDQVVQGGCVEHEVDVVRKKDDEIVYVEAKFHNSAAYKTDLKTVLYVKARIEDIEKKIREGRISGMVVTNTKFTSMAVRYANCVGLELLGWDYPEQGNLHDRIDASRLYPVTALTTLTRREKNTLLSQKMVLCNELSNNPGVLGKVGIRGKRAESALEEVGALCIPGGDI